METKATKPMETKAAKPKAKRVKMMCVDGSNEPWCLVLGYNSHWLFRFLVAKRQNDRYSSLNAEQFFNEEKVTELCVTPISAENQWCTTLNVRKDVGTDEKFTDNVDFTKLAKDLKGGRVAVVGVHEFWYSVPENEAPEFAGAFLARLNQSDNEGNKGDGGDGNPPRKCRKSPVVTKAGKGEKLVDCSAGDLLVALSEKLKDARVVVVGAWNSGEKASSMVEKLCKELGFAYVAISKSEVMRSSEQVRQRVIDAVVRSTPVIPDILGGYENSHGYTGLIQPSYYGLALFKPDRTGFDQVTVKPCAPGETTTIVASKGFRLDANHAVQDTGDTMTGRITFGADSALSIEWDSESNKTPWTKAAMPFQSITEWMDQYCEPHYLKLSDILAMKPGEKVEIVSFDRNWSDPTIDRKTNLPGVEYDPTQFFRNTELTYTHKGAVTGDIRWCWMSQEVPDEEMPLELQFAPHRWCSLDGEGRFPDSIARYGGREHVGKHYSSLPPDTLVGWRGPWIMKKHLVGLPKIAWWDDYTS
mmetsp:Transcript_12411/g.25274  ORF Transcript_12411/g.25274 Transcript_12411/m.25274 type:complete len:529 (-) Transcript_12411:339-1925(-)